MTAIPAIIPQSLPKDTAPARDILQLRTAGQVKENDGRLGAADGPKDQIRPDDGAPSFRKIFQEKKAEREAADGVKNAPVENGAKEKSTAAAGAAERAVRSAAKQAAVHAAAKTPSAVKQILSRLFEKNQDHDVKETKPKEKAKEKKSDRLDEAFSGIRALAFRERNEKAMKPSDANGGMKEVLAKAGADKAARQVVIVDLRDRATEKPNPNESARAVLSRQAAAKTETRETKKPADAKDAFETKVIYKPGVLPDRTEPGARMAASEPAAAKSDFSSRLAEVMKNDMVKHTGLVLRNGGEGEIHLVLKPESLGSIRIKLNLEDNHIVGKIIVDNNTVKQIMEENLGHLETALQQNGYQAAAFDVSVAGEKRNGPEEGSFSELVDEAGIAEASPAGPYESGGETIYADSLVNIVL